MKLLFFLIFFHGCEAALTSQICFPIRLVFYQHLNSHIAYPGIPPEPSNHTRGQFLHLPSYPLLRLPWSKSDNKVTRKRILDQYHTGTCWAKWSALVELSEVPVWYWSRILFLVTLLSDLDQSNLRRGYDGKCRNCPRVWFEGSGGMPG